MNATYDYENYKTYNLQEQRKLLHLKKRPILISLSQYLEGNVINALVEAGKGQILLFRIETVN